MYPFVTATEWVVPPKLSSSNKITKEMFELSSKIGLSIGMLFFTSTLNFGNSFCMDVTKEFHVISVFVDQQNEKMHKLVSDSQGNALHLMYQPMHRYLD